MNSKNKCFLWINYTRSRYFLIPENQNIPTGDFLIFNLTGEKKKVALTAITSLERTEEEAITYLEAELNQQLEQIEISEDIQAEIPKMLEAIFSESNLEKCLPEIINELINIEDKIKQSPELLQQVISELYTSLSQEYFTERETQQNYT